MDTELLRYNRDNNKNTIKNFAERFNSYKHIEAFPGQNPFHSLWMAGYECTDKLNAFGNRVDFLQVTGHLEKLDEDYRDLSLFNIKTVREGIQWSIVEKVPYQYDFSRVEKLIESG